MSFYPHEISTGILRRSGFDFDYVYNGKGGVRRQQLTVLSELSNVIGPFTDPNSGKTTTLKANAYLTIHRLHASANKKNIDFSKNIENTMNGTVSSSIMEAIKSKTTDEQKKELIRWLPSSAEEQDPFHALNYERVMTLGDALDKGLGTRYGCKCGMEFVGGDQSVVDDIIKAK